EVFRSWDFILAPNSAGAAIYSLVLFKLERIVFNAMLGDEEALMHSYLGVGTTILALQNGYSSRSKPLLIRLLHERDDRWFADSVVPNGPGSWDEALSSAFTEALQRLHEKLD